MRISIIGAGVSGLTCAHELLLAGHSVVLYAEDLPDRRTSAMATALWHVYLVGNDRADFREIDLATQTLGTLLELTTRRLQTGVQIVRGVELFRSSVAIAPPWSEAFPSFRYLSRKECRAYDGIRWGYEVQTVYADMPRYLFWLRRAVLVMGGVEHRRTVAHLGQLLEHCDMVVNCSGLASRELANDPHMIPVRGQYLTLAIGHRPSEASYVADDEDPEGMCYVVNRRSDVLVGGTEEYGVESTIFDADVSGMLRRASRLVDWLPRDSLPHVTSTVACLRPLRTLGVRVEVDPLTPRVVHNYGHGGSGFSMSWGCAREVVSLIEESI